MKSTTVLLLSIVLLACTHALGSDKPSQPTAKAAARAAQLKAGAKSFTLNVRYSGDLTKGYLNLYLSVPTLRAALTRNTRFAHLTEEQAKKIIDELASGGFFDQAHEGEWRVARGGPSPVYTMVVRADVQGKAIEFEEILEWGKPTLKRLDGLRTVLEGDAAKEMDVVLGKLSELRNEDAKTDKAVARAARLKAAIKWFTLEVCYQGDQIDRYDSLLLSVPVRRYMMPRNWRIVDIKEEQAKKIIDYLATDGFLDQAHEGVSKRLPKQSDYYTLVVRANGEGKSVVFEELVGWGKPLVKRLDDLRKVLDGDAAKEMDKLLGKLSALRKDGARTDKAQPTAKAVARAAKLKAAAKSFSLELTYQGGQVKKHDSLILSVPVLRVALTRICRFSLVTEEEAKKIIDCLAIDGFLDQAYEGEWSLTPPFVPCDYYTLLLRADGQGKAIMFQDRIDWGKPLLKRLDGLRKVLDGNAAKEMDVLLDKLSELRKEIAKMDKAVASKPNVAIRNFVSGIRTILPKGWECSLIDEKGKMGHPHGLDEPLFRVDFVNLKESFEYSSSPSKTRRLQPSLRLHFHPVADRQHIMKVIETERAYSWEIPVSFAETKEYLIVTSPAWINQGHYNDEAKKLMAPLEQALTKHFAGQK